MLPSLPKLPWPTPCLPPHWVPHRLHFPQHSICKSCKYIRNSIHLKNILIFPKLELVSDYTYNSLTGPCLHHKYELKISMSACSHCDECLSTESGRIIRSANLWFTGSSELDSTKSGAHRNSTVALYSCKRHKSSTQPWCTEISDFQDPSPAYNVS